MIDSTSSVGEHTRTDVDMIDDTGSLEEVGVELAQALDDVPLRHDALDLAPVG